MVSFNLLAGQGNYWNPRMKTRIIKVKMMTRILLSFAMVVLFVSCMNNKSSKDTEEQDKAANDSITIVRKPFNDNPSKIEYEIPILKGTKLRHGVQKRFSMDGCLYSEIPYTRNVRNGVAFTYYKAYGDKKPLVWKEQPYVNGKLNGICKRYHRDGVLQAVYSYKNGLREIGLKEFRQNGKEIAHPKLILDKKIGSSSIQITARMSNDTKNVKYYTGTLVEGKYVSENKKAIAVSNGVGKVSVSPNQKSVTIIAMLSTNYYNTYVTAKTISLK